MSSTSKADGAYADRGNGYGMSVSLSMIYTGPSCCDSLSSSFPSLVRSFTDTRTSTCYNGVTRPGLVNFLSNCIFTQQASIPKQSLSRIVLVLVMIMNLFTTQINAHSPITNTFSRNLQLIGNPFIYLAFLCSSLVYAQSLTDWVICFDPISRMTAGCPEPVVGGAQFPCDSPPLCACLTISG
jgi:hypothetical protein